MISLNFSMKYDNPPNALAQCDGSESINAIATASNVNITTTTGCSTENKLITWVSFGK